MAHQNMTFGTTQAQILALLQAINACTCLAKSRFQRILHFPFILIICGHTRRKTVAIPRADARSELDSSLLHCLVSADLNISFECPHVCSFIDVLLDLFFVMCPTIIFTSCGEQRLQHSRIFLGRPSSHKYVQWWSPLNCHCLICQTIILQPTKRSPSPPVQRDPGGT